MHDTKIRRIQAGKHCKSILYILANLNMFSAASKSILHIWPCLNHPEFSRFFLEINKQKACRIFLCYFSLALQLGSLSGPMESSWSRKSHGVSFYCQFFGSTGNRKRPHRKWVATLDTVLLFHVPWHSYTHLCKTRAAVWCVFVPV